MTNEELDRKVAEAQGWGHVANSDWDMGNGYYHSQYHPSTNWQQCGELIEKYKIDLEFNKEWEASIWNTVDNVEIGTGQADTPQQAVCLAVIAMMEYGDE